MTPLERFVAYEEVTWNEFKTFEERWALHLVYAKDSNYHMDFEYVGWVDGMNWKYYPNKPFRRLK